LTRSVGARVQRLTDVPDSCYRRSGFSINDSEESVYGDQGQEVAREVRQDRFNARRQQEEIKEHEVARSVRGRCWRGKQCAEYIGSTSERVGEVRPFELEAQCNNGFVS
jgi:hypothetical protein